MIGLNYIRILYNKTTTQLANEIGMTNGTISLWEQGKTIPLKRIEQLSTLFNIPAEYFTKELTDIDKLIIENIKLDQDIAKSEFEYEDTAYDKSVEDYINISKVGYDDTLIKFKSYNNAKIQKLKTLQKIDNVITERACGNSILDEISRIDYYSKWFDRFADFINEKGIRHNFLVGLFKALDICFRNKTDIWDAEEESQLVKDLVKIFETYKSEQNKNIELLKKLQDDLGDEYDEFI